MDQPNAPATWTERGIQIALQVWDKLTLRSIALAALASGVAIAGVYGWEHRDDVVPAVVGSSGALLAIIAVLVLIGMLLIGDAVLTRADRKGEALETHLRGQIAYLIKRVDEADDERAEMGRLLDVTIKKLDETALKEERCQRRLGRAEAAMAKAGLIPPAREVWGDTT